MSPLDRLFVGWSRGHNTRKKLDRFWFAPDAIHHDGYSVAVRVRDMNGKALILVRSFSVLIDVDLRRLFRGRNWTYAPSEHFIDVPNMIRKINAFRERAKNHWVDIALPEYGSLGQTLMAVKSYVRQNNLDFFITDLDHIDPVVLGAKFLAQGKAGAICVCPTPNSSWEKSYKLFHSFEDAVLFKLKNEGVELYDLS